MGYYQAHCWKRDRANSPLGVGVLLALLIGSLAWSQEVAMTGVLELKGSIHGVHDPVIAEENGSFYLFSTGRGIPRHCSDDLIQWRGCGLVFFGLPRWAREYVPGVTDIWAPDISFFNGRWHLYYSLSTFGSNVSAIGLATNRTLDPNSPEHEWVDEGVVIASRSTDSWNAIDPNIVIDTEGRVWLAFGVTGTASRCGASMRRQANSPVTIRLSMRWPVALFIRALSKPPSLSIGRVTTTSSYRSMPVAGG